jgi:hypothetical protein
MPKHPYTLSDAEVQILKKGQDDVNYAAAYWFKPDFGDPFLFDNNFEPAGQWQVRVHHAAQPNIIVVGGYGTGKTIGVGMSACVFGMSMANFKFLNTAPVAFQARQMFDGIISITKDTPFERLIWKKPTRPYPKIELKFYVGNVLIESQLEFMSVDKNAVNILSWEGDWINLDEGGTLDNLEEITGHLGSRLRGSIRGRSRLGRYSITSNSWDNFFMWYLFDLAADQPEEYLSLVLSTRDNKNVTDAQLKQMLSKIPEEEHKRWIDGTRPEGKGTYFNRDEVFACEDPDQTQRIRNMISSHVKGYLLKFVRGPGYYYMLEPFRPGHMYIMTGDPGIYNAPRRNAPVIGVFDCTDFPQKPARLVAFWWGFGNGSITPFVNMVRKLKKIYNPIICGVDSTGPQKNQAELMNIFYFEPTEKELEEDPSLRIPLTPLDFSGSKRMSYLVALRLMIKETLLRWPKVLNGIRSQLTNYEPTEDKKLAQDIVAMFAMAAHVLFRLFGIGNVEVDDEEMDRRTKQMATEHKLEDQRYRREAVDDRNRRNRTNR